MKNASSKYPEFDHLELDTELEFDNIKSYKKLQPLKSGYNIALEVQQTAYGFSALQHKYGETPKLSKILVAYFYSKHWGELGLEHLKQLNAIRNEVKFHDGNIVVIDADGDERGLQQLLWDNNLVLPIHTDNNALLAKLFKVYSDDSPAWNFYGGIDVNVPLPAIFVVDHSFKIIFDYSNEELLSRIPSQEIVSTVFRSNNYLAGKRSA
ncbi:redoxin domain-containing protein [Mucilaginibacter terrae]|uniref:Peroxiredoxin n=1 Tax=Mucilaginibacter terrae TaxID=1955052 RepID=A0ABU3H0D2_9SPHI|nr:redoxin domain-containing protein [Mucilaginibacter terrae]MDT3405481.1 peroxiredoxin [Mucilaginibacter terrae]